MTMHVHCDSDPIECGVEALEGEYMAVLQQRDELRREVVRLRTFAAAIQRAQADYFDSEPSRRLRPCASRPLRPDGATSATGLESRQ